MPDDTDTHTPTEDDILRDLDFWAEETARLVRVLGPMLEEAATSGADATAAGITVDWKLVNHGAVAWARSYAYDLVGGLIETDQARLQVKLREWMASGDPLPALVEAVRPLFGAHRATLVTVTETTRGFAQGTRETIRGSGGTHYRFNTVHDAKVCPDCSPLDGHVYHIDDDEHMPPIDPHCRCFITPAEVPEVADGAETAAPGQASPSAPAHARLPQPLLTDAAIVAAAAGHVKAGMYAGPTPGDVLPAWTPATTKHDAQLYLTHARQKAEAVWDKYTQSTAQIALHGETPALLATQQTARDALYVAGQRLRHALDWFAANGHHKTITLPNGEVVDISAHQQIQKPPAKTAAEEARELIVHGLVTGATTGPTFATNTEAGLYLTHAKQKAKPLWATYVALHADLAAHGHDPAKATALQSAADQLVVAGQRMRYALDYLSAHGHHGGATLPDGSTWTHPTKAQANQQTQPPPMPPPPPPTSVSWHTTHGGTPIEAYAAAQLAPLHATAEMEAWAVAHFHASMPETAFDFAGMHPERVREVLTTLARLQADFPNVAKTLKYIGMGAHPHQQMSAPNFATGAHANAGAYTEYLGLGTTVIVFNPKFAQPPKSAAEQLLAEANAQAYAAKYGEPFIVAGGLRTLLVHEFGHVIDTVMAKPSANAALLDAHGVPDTTNISKYAKSEAGERWAEAFAAAYLTTNADPFVNTVRLILTDFAKGTYPSVATAPKKPTPTPAKTPEQLAGAILAEAIKTPVAAGPTFTTKHDAILYLTHAKQKAQPAYAAYVTVTQEIATLGPSPARLTAQGATQSALEVAANRMRYALDFLATTDHHASIILPDGTTWVHPVKSGGAQTQNQQTTNNPPPPGPLPDIPTLPGYALAAVTAVPAEQAEPTWAGAQGSGAQRRYGMTIYNEHGQVLLFQSMKGNWLLPSAAYEYGHHPADVLLKLLKKEIGATPQILGAEPGVYAAANGTGDRMYYVGRVHSGLAKLSAGAAWVDAADVAKTLAGSPDVATAAHTQTVLDAARAKLADISTGQPGLAMVAPAKSKMPEPKTPTTKPKAKPNTQTTNQTQPPTMISALPAPDVADLKAVDLHAIEPTWAKPGKNVSYGGVVIDDAGRVLLREPSNHYMGYVWTFPKGGPDPGDHAVDAALREVREETGHTGEIVGLVPGKYRAGSGNDVFYFLMRSTHDTGVLDHETTQVRWASFAEARLLLKQTLDVGHNAEGYARDLAVLDAAEKTYHDALAGKSVLPPGLAAHPPNASGAPAPDLGAVDPKGQSAFTVKALGAAIATKYPTLDAPTAKQLLQAHLADVAAGKTTASALLQQYAPAGKPNAGGKYTVDYKGLDPAQVDAIGDAMAATPSHVGDSLTTQSAYLQTIVTNIVADIGHGVGYYANKYKLVALPAGAVDYQGLPQNQVDAIVRASVVANPALYDKMSVVTSLAAQIVADAISGARTLDTAAAALKITLPPAPQSPPPNAPPGPPVDALPATYGELAAMAKIAGPSGGMAGQWYEDGTGNQFYAKPQQSAANAYNEVGAAAVYRALGLDPGADIPFTRVLTDAHGTAYVVSQKLPGLSWRKKPWWQGPESALGQATAARAWAVDVLLSHWDVVGANPDPAKGYDNIMLDSGGHAVRIETGGAMATSGTGARKPSWRVGGEWVDAWTMRGIDHAGRSGGETVKAVFGHITDGQAADMLERLARTWDAHATRAALAATGMPAAQVATTMAVLEDRIARLPKIIQELRDDQLAALPPPPKDVTWPTGTTTHAGTKVLDGQIVSLAGQFHPNGAGVAGPNTNHTPVLPNAGLPAADQDRHTPADWHPSAPDPTPDAQPEVPNYYKQAAAGDGLLALTAPLKANEKGGLTAYTGQTYIAINTAMRSGKPGAGSSYTYAGGMDGGMQKSAIPVGMRLWRGTDIPGLSPLLRTYEAKFDQGDYAKWAEVADLKWEDLAFQSNAKTPDKAWSGTKLELVYGPGMHAVDVEAFSHHSGELEIVGERGIQFRVIGYRKRGSYGLSQGFWIVEVTKLP